MDETGDAQVPAHQETPRALEPIGDVVIGTVNPATLSQEQFNASPELLYHGAKEDFEFSQDFDYVYEEQPGSHTIGQGFYATPDRENALMYGRERMGEQSEPAVIAVMPYQARMLDLRLSQNPTLNAPVPKNLAKEYLEFVKNKFSEIDTTVLLSDRRQRSLYAERLRVKNNLEDLLREDKRIYLRHMMNGEGEGSTSDTGAVLLSEFMTDKGYDGIIYNEGGDQTGQTHTLSYVFYNLDRIGTYETWHQAGN